MFGSLTGIDILYFIIAILISLPIHEAMHAFSAHWLGDTTAEEQGRLSLNPLKHIDPFATLILPIITIILFKFPFLAAKPVPFNPFRVKYHEYGAAIVAVAGPLSNFFLAVIAAIFLRLTHGAVLENFFLDFTVINVALFVFNLIPIPPLDGSRVLYAFAPEAIQEFMSKIETFGIFIILALFILFQGSFSNFLIHTENSVLNIIL